MKRVRAMVEVSDKHDSKTRLWGYGYADLAELLQLDEGTLRNWVSQKKLDPSDLAGLVRLALARRPELGKPA